jgi:hypothetical protein
MSVSEIKFVVIVQVVRCADDRDDTTKIVFSQPDDLFLAANPTVIDAISTGPFTDSDLVFNDPCEIARGDPERPLSS